MVNCQFCGKEWKNNSVLASHRRFCSDNPNPIKYNKKVNNNQYTKAKAEGRTVEISDETRDKMRKASKGRKLSAAHRKIISESVRSRGFGGVTKSRWIHYKDKILGSSYEYKLVLDLESNGVLWNTCKRFKYVDPNGKHRTYTPDIYLPEYDVYLDPKNDFLIENINPALGFSDIDKINLVMKQNKIRVIVLNKNQLTWKAILSLISIKSDAPAL
jgi:hypothetical protein